MKLALSLLILMTGVLCAADDVRQVSCRLLNFNRAPDGIDTLVVYDSGGRAIDCSLPRESFSKPVALPAVDGRIEFRREGGGDPIAVARIPANLTHALLLFIPSPHPDEVFRPFVLDGSGKGYPEGVSLVLNLYHKEVRFFLGEHTVQLAPGKVAHLERPEKRDNFNMAGVSFQFETEDDWRTAYESMIRFPEGQRRLFVAHVDPKAKRPRIRVYRD